MTKVRLYELAKELNMSSKELMEKMADLDMKVNSHMSSLDGDDAKLIKELFSPVEVVEEISEVEEEDVKYSIF